jgi:hypothetical protein
MMTNQYWSLSVPFLCKKNEGSAMHRVTQNLVEGVGVSYTNARKKVVEGRSGLRPSEKELTERRTGAYHHKNIPGSCADLI